MIVSGILVRRFREELCDAKIRLAQRERDFDEDSGAGGDELFGAQEDVRIVESALALARLSDHFAGIDVIRDPNLLRLESHLRRFSSITDEIEELLEQVDEILYPLDPPTVNSSQ